MNLAHHISKLIIFLIIMFRILNFIPSGLKDTPRLICIIWIGTSLALFLQNNKRSRIADYSLLFIILVSSIGFTNFLIDLFVEPKILAIDCDGHHSVGLSWMKGFLFGPLLTFALWFGTMKHKIEKTVLDRILIVMCLLLLLLSVF